MGRIIGLDVGDVRIGVAISDELEITAQGLQTIRRKRVEEDIDSIKKIIELNDVGTIVVGLPKMMNGTIGIQAQKVIDFTDILRTKVNIPVFFWDERLTTAEVNRRLIEAGVRRNKRREVVDKLSAQLILQGFLDKKAIIKNRHVSGFLGLLNSFWLLSFCLLFIFAITAGIVYIRKSITTPVSHIDSPRIVNIPKGSDLKAVSSILKKEGIIDSSLIFNILARYKSAEGGLKAGEYSLSPNMSPLQILSLIQNGKVYQYPVTIPEGYNIFEAASLLHKKGLVNKERFISLAFNGDFIKSLGVETDNLEGYIFPDTYYISRGMDEKVIIKKMVDTFKSIVLDKMLIKIKDRGLTIRQIITIASLIEKETGKEDEKPVISAVFYNRIKKEMRLQCDPTVIYALLIKSLKGGTSSFDGNIRKDDLMIDSPYNTYKYSGLPPGPIANPGMSSINAAINPSDSNYLYFVSKQDGWHYFSSTIEEHNKAVNKYQINSKNTLKKLQSS